MITDGFSEKWTGLGRSKGSVRQQTKPMAENGSGRPLHRPRGGGLDAGRGAADARRAGRHAGALRAGPAGEAKHPAAAAARTSTPPETCKCSRTCRPERRRPRPAFNPWTNCWNATGGGKGTDSRARSASDAWSNPDAGASKRWWWSRPPSRRS